MLIVAAAVARVATARRQSHQIPHLQSQLELVAQDQPLPEHQAQPVMTACLTPLPPLVVVMAVHCTTAAAMAVQVAAQAPTQTTLLVYRVAQAQQDKAITEAPVLTEVKTTPAAVVEVQAQLVLTPTLRLHLTAATAATAQRQALLDHQ